MDVTGLSLQEYTERQLYLLGDAIGMDVAPAAAGLRALLDPIGARSLDRPPVWPTDISDDHTPVEFSLACERGRPAALRILGEKIAQSPNRASNLLAALGLVDTLAEQLSLPLDQFHRVCRVFLRGQQCGDFGIWFSLIHRSHSPTEVKIYFNPDARGRRYAPRLVAEAFRTLQMDDAYATVVEHGVRPGELNRRDRFTFFAVDLHTRPDSRVKLYVSHHGADVHDLIRAARVVPGVDTGAVRELLELTGCTGPLTGRPLVSGYSFVRGDTDRPSTYSMYLPIRDYVCDDEHARELTRRVLDWFGLDPVVMDRALEAVAGRPLCDGVGVIAHLSLRLSAHRPPGVSVYLSSEAYRVSAPRSGGPGDRRSVAAGAGGAPCR